MDSKDLILIEDLYGAHNYHPLDVVVSKAKGIWMWDVEGKKYLDFLAAYSAANQGHCHPRIIKALQAQARSLTLTSRAFRNDQWPMLAKELCDWTGYEMVLPMNSGAEAVETAVKAARMWGYQVKGIPEDRAEIIACTNNFHGRTVTVISFSTEPLYRKDFGPFTPGFPIIPFGDAEALEKAITPNTRRLPRRAHPGRGGHPHPPRRLPEEGQGDLREEQGPLHRRRDPDGPRPRGPALRLRIRGRPAGYRRPSASRSAAAAIPISAVLADRDILGLFKAGSHGSTFGGNPLACAVAREAIRVTREEKLIERAAELGAYFLAKLKTIRSKRIKEIRGRGLLIGIELHPEAGGARKYCEELMKEGLLCKETHENVIRFAPPLVIREKDLNWAYKRIKAVFKRLA